MQLFPSMASIASTPRNSLVQSLLLALDTPVVEAFVQSKTLSVLLALPSVLALPLAFGWLSQTGY